MILSDQEMQEIRDVIEAQAGWDEELLQRCGPLIHLGQFDEAVRSAFILLEERLRESIHEEGMTGTALVNKGFGKNGVLVKHLARSTSEQEGYRELFAGAFKLFRNPTAHGAVDYNAAQGKAIIGLVNLLLQILNRVGELPPVDLFPENVENLLLEFEAAIGAAASGRLRRFLAKAIQIPLSPATSSKQWIAFKRPALAMYDGWERPKPHRVGVFYLFKERSVYGIRFPINYYYSKVVGIDLDMIIEELRRLGFKPLINRGDFDINLKHTNSEQFFQRLLEAVQMIDQIFEDTLENL